MESGDTRIKDLEYFMALPYRIEISPIPDNEGGGFTASIPELGRWAVCGDGDTIEEALTNLESVKIERLTDHLHRGVHIPEPLPPEEQYSGKFVVRLPRSLHRELALAARDEGVSLNSLVTSILSRGVVEQERQDGSTGNSKATRPVLAHVETAQ